MGSSTSTATPPELRTPPPARRAPKSSPNSTVQFLSPSVDCSRRRERPPFRCRGWYRRPELRWALDRDGRIRQPLPTGLTVTHAGVQRPLIELQSVEPADATWQPGRERSIRGLLAEVERVPELANELEAVVGDLGELWSAPTTLHRDRKRLLRTLVADVTLIPDPDRSKLRIGIHWHSGSTEEFVVQRMQRITESRRTAPEAVALARLLGPELDNHALAANLNAAGHRTGAGRAFDSDAVSSLRHYHGIGSPDLLEPGELTVRDVASRLGVNHGAVIHWINRGMLAARRGLYNRWCVPFSAEVEAVWREHVAACPHVHTDIDPRPAQPSEVSIAQVARALGVKPDVVYHWAATGHLPWRRGPGGRKYVEFTPDLEAACRQRIPTSVHLPADIKSKAQHALTGGSV